MKEVKGGEEKSFPKKCAYLRRWKKKLLFLAALTAIICVLLGGAIWNGSGAAIILASLLATYVLVIDILCLLVYGKIQKKCERCRQMFPLKINRAMKRLQGRKRYYFEVVCTDGQESGKTEALYSKRAARRAEEAFQKGELRVFYDPEGNVEQVIFPDI